jgi:hypothetical protein
MKKEHYKLVNGFSNYYFGWGSEDDDHRKRYSLIQIDLVAVVVDVEISMCLSRIIARNLTISNPASLPLGKYFMFRHDKADENPLR